MMHDRICRDQKAIIDSLSYDLLEPKYRATLAPDDPPETGHCAVASEAFYHMAGGREAGYMPVVCGYAVLPSGEMVFDKKPDSRRNKTAPAAKPIGGYAARKKINAAKARFSM